MCKFPIANILLSSLSSDSKPAEPSSYSFNEIPRIKRIHEGFPAKKATLISRLWIGNEARDGLRSDDFGTPNIIDLPGKGP